MSSKLLNKRENFVKEINKLIIQGKSLKEIAKHFNIRKTSLETKIFLLRKEGFQIEYPSKQKKLRNSMFKILYKTNCADCNKEIKRETKRCLSCYRKHITNGNKETSRASAQEKKCICCNKEIKHNGIKCSLCVNSKHCKLCNIRLSKSHKNICSNCEIKKNLKKKSLQEILREMF